MKNNTEQWTRQGWTEAGLAVCAERYFTRDISGAITEDIEGMCRRVATAIAQAEEKWDPQAVAEMEARFYDLLFSRRFMPNSPTLNHAGTSWAAWALPFSGTDAKVNRL